MSCHLYWVQIGPRTVVSLRGLRAFCGDDAPPTSQECAASRLVIEPGITFHLDGPQTERAWTAVEKVYAIEGLVPALGPGDAGDAASTGPGSDAPDAGPSITPGIKPPRPAYLADPAAAPAPGDDPGVVREG